MTQAPKQAYEAWRITHQSSELAARSAFDTAEMLQQELLTARATISNLERDELTAITQRDDASDFIDKILDEVLGQDRHEWTSAYDRDDALADVEAKMAALKSSKCLHQIAEPAAHGLDAPNLYYLQDARHHAMVGNCPSFWRPDGNGYTTNLDEAARFTLEAAMKQHKCRETDLPWLCSEVDKLRRPTVDCQYMPRSWDAQRAALAAQTKQGGAA